MKKAILKLTALVILLGSQALMVNAQSQANAINVVTSAVPFLRISPDARSGGMGDVGIATTPDANSAFWNLAKTPFNTSTGWCGTYLYSMVKGSWLMMFIWLHFPGIINWMNCRPFHLL